MNFIKKNRERGGIFAYKGRVGRFRFFVWNLSFNILALIAFGLMVSAKNVLISIFLLLIIFLINLLQSLNFAKRLHDINLPGWPGILVVFAMPTLVNAFFADISEASSMINLIKLIAALSMLLIPGSKGSNKYGPEYGAEYVMQEIAEES